MNSFIVLPCFTCHFLFCNFFSVVFGPLKYRWHKWFEILVSVKDGFDEEAARFLLAFYSLAVYADVSHNPMGADGTDQSRALRVHVLFCLHI